MERYDEIITALNSCNAEIINVVSPLIDNICFIEKRLEELRGFPFLSINPKNKTQQRITPAYRQYKELYQQYTLSVKIIIALVDDREGSEESPLKLYFKNKLESLEVR